MRWERWWHLDGQPFRDLADYPIESVAASGTHDTEPLMTWWNSTPEEDRRQLNDLPTVQAVTMGRGLLDQSPSEVRDGLIQALYASASKLVLLPVQDAFGWCDRINVPATITPDNWTFRLPWPSDRLDDIPEARDCQARLRAWAEKYER
jgi:4-alpha-glucanotransferase